MARNELFKAENETLNTVDESFMKAVHTVQDLMNENNSSLSFFSELEKSITKKAPGQEQQHTAMKENKNLQKKSTKRKFKVSFARKMKKKRSHSKKNLFQTSMYIMAVAPLFRNKIIF